MNIYELSQIVDNPLFEGLALLDGAEVFDTWPKDWRINYKTWEPFSLKATWMPLQVYGKVRKHNDFPCINLVTPAFSQRAVDFLRDMLEPNGELLPVRHKIGTYYFYNCRKMMNCVDLSKSEVTKLKDGGVVTSTDRLVFLDDLLDDLTVFKVRTQLLETFCTQTFVDRVNAASLQGFAFIPIWPLPSGVTFNDERHRVSKAFSKWKPKDFPDVDVKENTVVIRLYCEGKKPSAAEKKAAEAIEKHLDNLLYDPNQSTPESLFGDLEGMEFVDGEYRLFFSTPDCDRLVAKMMPELRTLAWPGLFHVIKRRGTYVDETANGEYVPIV